MEASWSVLERLERLGASLERLGASLKRFWVGSGHGPGVAGEPEGFERQVRGSPRRNLPLTSRTIFQKLLQYRTKIKYTRASVRPKSIKKHQRRVKNRVWKLGAPPGHHEPPKCSACCFKWPCWTPKIAPRGAPRSPKEAPEGHLGAPFRLLERLWDVSEALF